MAFLQEESRVGLGLGVVLEVFGLHVVVGLIVGVVDVGSSVVLVACVDVVLVAGICVVLVGMAVLVVSGVVLVGVVCGKLVVISVDCSVVEGSVEVGSGLSGVTGGSIGP